MNILKSTLANKSWEVGGRSNGKYSLKTREGEAGTGQMVTWGGYSANVVSGRIKCAVCEAT